MSPKIIVAAVIGLALLLTPAALSFMWVSSAEDRLEQLEAEQAGAPQVAVAQEANEAYCTQSLKQILRRVLTSCGLIGGGGGRGCQPVEARNVATMDDADFNALFLPMESRGGIIQYDQSSAE